MRRASRGILKTSICCPHKKNNNNNVVRTQRMSLLDLKTADVGIFYTKYKNSVHFEIFNKGFIII